MLVPPGDGSPPGRPRELASRRKAVLAVPRLVAGATPAVLDVVAGARVPVGPDIDEARAWAAYGQTYPDRRYAISKRALSRAELRRRGLGNRET
jgi:hypothetical protein